jgi:hypothetical protein
MTSFHIRIKCPSLAQHYSYFIIYSPSKSRFHVIPYKDDIWIVLLLQISFLLWMDALYRPNIAPIQQLIYLLFWIEVYCVDIMRPFTIGNLFDQWNALWVIASIQNHFYFSIRELKWLGNRYITWGKPCAMRIASTVWGEIFRSYWYWRSRSSTPSDELRVRVPGNPDQISDRYLCALILVLDLIKLNICFYSQGTNYRTTGSPERW